MLQVHLDERHAISAADSFHTLCLETSSQAFLQATIKRYQAYGFKCCRSFASYKMILITNL
jgi:hypothetical protein